MGARHWSARLVTITKRHSVIHITLSYHDLSSCLLDKFYPRCLLPWMPSMSARSLSITFFMELPRYSSIPIYHHLWLCLHLVNAVVKVWYKLLLLLWVMTLFVLSPLFAKNDLVHTMWLFSECSGFKQPSESECIKDVLHVLHLQHRTI